MSVHCSVCSGYVGLECSGGDNCFFFKYGLREKMMEDNEYFDRFKNFIDKVYDGSMDLFQFLNQLTCHINSHIMGAEVAAKIAAAQFSATQAAASAAQAAASAAQAAASAAQAFATVADQEAATVGADEVVNESAGIRFWNKTKALDCVS